MSREEMYHGESKSPAVTGCDDRVALRAFPEDEVRLELRVRARFGRQLLLRREVKVSFELQSSGENTSYRGKDLLCERGPAPPIELFLNLVLFRLLGSPTHALLDSLHLNFQH